MITRSDALELMAVVTACHRRTAPRLDDRDVARATADVWAELFNEYHLEQPDLVAAVKKRALANADAPEPAEIIAFAREIRRDRDARTGPTTAYEALCDSKSEPHAHELQANQDRLSALIAPVAAAKGIDRA